LAVSRTRTREQNSAAELQEHCIRVNAVNLGWTVTGARPH
jgi:hypothetical protein